MVFMVVFHVRPRLPGFRKGKAPLEVIKKQYKSAVREEIIHHELPEFFRSALIDQKIDPVAQPQIYSSPIRGRFAPKVCRDS